MKQKMDEFEKHDNQRKRTKESKRKMKIIWKKERVYNDEKKKMEVK